MQISPRNWGFVNCPLSADGLRNPHSVTWTDQSALQQTVKTRAKRRELRPDGVRRLLRIGGRRADFCRCPPGRANRRPVKSQPTAVCKKRLVDVPLVPK